MLGIHPEDQQLINQVLYQAADMRYRMRLAPAQSVTVEMPDNPRLRELMPYMAHMLLREKIIIEFRGKEDPVAEDANVMRVEVPQRAFDNPGQWVRLRTYPGRRMTVCANRPGSQVQIRACDTAEPVRVPTENGEWQQVPGTRVQVKATLSDTAGVVWMRLAPHSNRPTGTQVLAVPMQENDAEAATIREYLVSLLHQLWSTQDAFSGKRPFGESGWVCELELALGRAGLVDYAEGEDGLASIDADAAHRLIRSAIVALGEAP